MRTLQEKAFPFLEKDYMLSELCQGILKAGKFSLAKNYLKGTGTTVLRPQKAEKLVLNAAREYFYSAPDLDSSAVRAFCSEAECQFIYAKCELPSFPKPLLGMVSEKLSLMCFEPWPKIRRS